MKTLRILEWKHKSKKAQDEILICRWAENDYLSGPCFMESLHIWFAKKVKYIKRDNCFNQTKKQLYILEKLQYVVGHCFILQLRQPNDKPNTRISWMPNGVSWAQQYQRFKIYLIVLWNWTWIVLLGVQKMWDINTHTKFYFMLFLFY